MSQQGPCVHDIFVSPASFGTIQTQLIGMNKKAELISSDQPAQLSLPHHLIPRQSLSLTPI